MQLKRRNIPPSHHSNYQQVFFKDFFYYHIHHIKTTNPAYAFEFLWQKSYS